MSGKSRPTSLVSRLLGAPRPAVTACLMAIVCTGLAGCRTLSSQKPSAQAVTTCRQLTQQGISAMERGDWSRAESLLARAVQTSKVDADARRHYAETLCHRGAMQEALVQWEEARRLTGEDPALAVRTGEAYLALGQVDHASQRVDDALRLDPKFAPAWTLRGRVASAAGQSRQALSDYQRAQSYAPDDHELALLIAEAYRQLNEPERALLALQSLADSYSPGEEPQQVLYLQGLALSALGRYDDAMRLLAAAAHRDHPTAEILCRLAEAELLAGRIAEAQTTVQQALELGPDHAPSRALAARMAMVPAPDTPIRR